MTPVNLAYLSFIESARFHHWIAQQHTLHKSSAHDVIHYKMIKLKQSYMEKREKLNHKTFKAFKTVQHSLKLERLRELKA